MYRPNHEGTYTCEVESWCPIEVDELPRGLNGQALMGNAAGYTVFIKNSVAFPYFGKEYVRNNLVNKSCKMVNGVQVCKNKPCLYKRGEGGDNRWRLTFASLGRRSHRPLHIFNDHAREGAGRTGRGLMVHP